MLGVFFFLVVVARGRGERVNGLILAYRVTFAGTLYV